MSVPARAAVLIVAFLAVVGLGIFVAVYYIGSDDSAADRSLHGV